MISERIYALNKANLKNLSIKEQFKALDSEHASVDIRTLLNLLIEKHGESSIIQKLR